MKTAYHWIRACRVHQWVKNTFVLAPLLFSGRLGDPEAVMRGIGAFFSFCFLSSSIYLFNDVMDRERDRLHPKKMKRPIAAGLISVPAAIVVGVFLLVGSVTAAFAIDWRFGAIALTYVANNIAYTFVLKHKVIADVISISLGFILRFVGGAFAIDAELARFFMVTTFSLSLFLAFGKRRTEVAQLGEQARSARPVMLSYDIPKLNASLAMTCTLTIMSYLLYVTAPETVARHGTNALIVTTPIVVYGLLRYMFKVMEGSGGGPTEIILKDKILVLTGALWLLTVMICLYAI